MSCAVKLLLRKEEQEDNTKNNNFIFLSYSSYSSSSIYSYYSPLLTSSLPPASSCLGIYKWQIVGHKWTEAIRWLDLGGTVAILLLSIQNCNSSEGTDLFNICLQTKVYDSSMKQCIKRILNK